MAVRICALAASVAWVVCLVGCGTAVSDRDARPTGQERLSRATIHFLIDEGRAALGVRRTVDQVPWYRGGRTRAVLLALLAGPTQRESQAGLTTAIPEGTRLRSITFRGYGGTGAVIDLTGLPERNGADGVQRVRILTQVARTVIGSGVRRVWLRSSGRPWGLWLMEGGIDERPIDYNTLLGFNVCAAKPGTEAIPGDCFSALP